MFFKRKPHRSKSSQKGVFEKAFTDRIGQPPVEFIFQKLSAGSDKRVVEYLWDITAAEIARKNHCTAMPFSSFYPEAAQLLQVHLQRTQENNALVCQYQIIQKNIKICQREFLNKKDTQPFGAQCGCEMDLLYADSSFCAKITQIAKENAQIEFCDDAQSPAFLKFKRELLPKRMDELGVTENALVQSICDHVVATGKSRKSALITIYYAVRMYTLKRTINK